MIRINKHNSFCFSKTLAVDQIPATIIVGNESNEYAEVRAEIREFEHSNSKLEVHNFQS